MQKEISLHIDLSKKQPLSSYLFGHNLEHTRAAVSGGLSAQMLRNRKFSGRPGSHSGVAAQWQGIGRYAFFRNDIDPYVCHYKPNGMWRRNELNAQTVQNPVNERAGISQNGLAVFAGKEYICRIAVKSSIAQDLEIQISGAGKQLARESIRLMGIDWETHEVRLIPEKNWFSDASVSFTICRQSIVIFGAVSLMPAQNFYGMRTDVVELLRRLGVGILRWPAKLASMFQGIRSPGAVMKLYQ